MTLEQIAVKERPILFSAPMVRAILAGRKTVTRRIIKPQPPEYIDALHGYDLRGRAPYRIEHDETGAILGSGFQDDNDVIYKCPYGQPGDRLWVRETHMTHGDEIAYAATDQPLVGCDKWKPSIFMPRWASRISLEVTGVRVERLQDISERDAELEGAAICEHFAAAKRGHPLQPHKTAFAWLWNKINGWDAWIANPWVWVVSFKKVEA